MTHKSSHIIIHSLTQTVSVGEESVPPKAHKVKLWQVGLALISLGFLLRSLI
jgi:hypothetical protein